MKILILFLLSALHSMVSHAKTACFPLTDVPVTAEVNSVNLESSARVEQYEIGLKDGVVQTVRNRSTDKTCEITTAERVHSIRRFSKTHLILVESGGPSNAYLEILDLEKCKHVWEVETFKSAFVENKLFVDPYSDCGEGRETTETCQWFPGGVFALDSHCRPKKFPSESIAYNKRIAGVAFGQKVWIDQARTPKAKIVPAKKPKS